MLCSLIFFFFEALAELLSYTVLSFKFFKVVGGLWAGDFKAKVMMMRVADVFLPKLSFYLSTYLFFPHLCWKWGSRKHQKLAQGYLGCQLPTCGQAQTSSGSLSSLPSNISIRVVCCGLNIPRLCISQHVPVCSQSACKGLLETSWL